MSIKIKSSREKKVADSDDLVADGTPTMTVEDAAAFECGVCYLPFKPPIFQCIEGHAVCSTCREKLTATGGNTTKCYVCRVDLGKRGYTRSYAMERMVESVRVPCPNAVHGCAARMTYYDRSSHQKACPHTRYSCSAAHGCGGFVGSVGALLDHVASVHTNNTESMQQFWAEELSSLMNKMKLRMAASDIGMEIDPRDVELVMIQAGVSMDEAAKAVKEARGDIVKAILDLTLTDNDDDR